MLFYSDVCLSYQWVDDCGEICSAYEIYIVPFCLQWVLFSLFFFSEMLFLGNKFLQSVWKAKSNKAQHTFLRQTSNPSTYVYFSHIHPFSCWRYRKTATTTKNRTYKLNNIRVFYSVPMITIHKVCSFVHWLHKTFCSQMTNEMVNRKKEERIINANAEHCSFVDGSMDFA